MTSDDDDLSEMNAMQPTDPEVEAILGGGQPSGDAALDAVLDELRDLGRGPAPAPSAQLRQALGLGLTAVPGTEARPTRKGRHIATGSATLAGIVLASATAAAALGVHEATTTAPHPRPAPHATPLTPPSTTRSPPPTTTSSPARHNPAAPGVLPSLVLPAAPFGAVQSERSGADAGEHDGTGEPDTATRHGDADEATTSSTEDSRADDDARPNPAQTATRTGAGEDRDGE
jgi:hypothetical protein